jgi:hypothetical protein
MDVTYYIFNANTNTISKWISVSDAALNDGGETTYQPVTGYISDSSNDTGEEATINTRIEVTGTWKNLTAYVHANNRGNTTTIRSRKNAANGNQVISVPAGQTGWFTDSTHTDSISPGDIVDIGVTLGANDANFNVTVITSEFETTTDTGVVVTGDSDPETQAAGTTRYLAITGYTDPWTSEAGTKVTVPFACTWSKLSCNVEVNGTTDSTTLRTRKNGMNGGQSLTIPASTTGRFQDLSSSDSVAINDDINYQSITGAGGGVLSYGSISSCTNVSLSRSLLISKAMFTASK